MRLNGFRCDNCNTEHLLDPTLTFQSIVNVLPTDWIMVIQEHKKEKPWENQEPLLFCSKPCLVAWANRKPVEVEDLIRRA